jgi:glycine amidinotransferase
MSKQKTIVNSWNEWDPLKHVIVGRSTGTVVQASEPNVFRDWPEHGFPAGTYGPLPKEMEDKANEQLDNFADMLEKRGIRVDRPTPMDFSWHFVAFGCQLTSWGLTPKLYALRLAKRPRWSNFTS